MPRQNHCPPRACLETFKLGYKPISSWSENHINTFKIFKSHECISNLQVQSENLSKCGKINFLNTSNGTIISELKKYRHNPIELIMHCTSMASYTMILHAS